MELGKQQHYPTLPAMRYLRDIRPLIDQMLKEYHDELRDIGLERDAEITQDESLAEKARRTMRRLMAKFEKIFEREAPKIVDGLLQGLNKASIVSTTQSLKETSANLTLATKPLVPGLMPIISQATKANVALIKSIPVDFHGQIYDAVISSVSPGGHGQKTIMDTLERYDGVTRRRAQFIALDQSRKVTAAINSQRARAAGAKRFRWIHSGGGAHPRELHKFTLNGNIYEYDNPPIIDERTGERGLPGQLPNCRCTAQPVFDFDEDE